MGCKNWNQGKNAFYPIISEKNSWLRKVVYTYRIILEKKKKKKGKCFPYSYSSNITPGCYFCSCLITLPQKERRDFLWNIVCLWVKESKSQMNHKSCPKEFSTAVKQDTDLYKYILRLLESNTTAQSTTQPDWPPLTQCCTRPLSPRWYDGKMNNPRYLLFPILPQRIVFGMNENESCICVWWI